MNAPASCPFHTAAAQAPAVVARTSALVLPRHQRMVVQEHVGDEGQPELRLFHDDKEISFDEPELFGFGRMLARQSRFVAEDALQWAPECDWPRLQPLLQTLVDEGVLRLDGEDADVRAARDLAGERPAPLPPGPNPRPRRWQDSEALMLELAGRPLEFGWLELVVPVFRVAHMALDAEGRQVGEANVFPPAMRMDVPTRWRTCIYPGTRFDTGRPMNVSALKSMREHWPVMMQLLARVRAAYLRRCPEAAAGFTVGQLERLATAVLALPSYLLMRSDIQLPEGAMHPALSSLFRVTDGLRMTLHQMLFVPIGEPTLLPDAPIDAAAVMAYAERNHSLHSEHGVCAGPQAMIEEFLAVLVEGRATLECLLPPAVEDALRHLEPAIDYAMLGLQAHAAAFSLWPAMSRAYEQLHAAARLGASDGDVAWQAWHRRLERHVEQLRHATYLGQEAWRTDREQVYDDMEARCGRVLGQSEGPSLSQRLHRTDPALQASWRAALGPLLARALPAVGQREATAREATLQVLVAYLGTTQAVLREATAAQARINAHLGRSAPVQPFTAHDLDLHNRLQGRLSRRLPYLLDELHAGLGLHFDFDARRIGVAFTESTGMGPADTRAEGTLHRPGVASAPAH